MKEITIVGAGSLGREVLDLIKAINEKSPKYVIKGFIDDNQDALKGFRCDSRIIGTIKDWKPGENEVFALAISTPSVKEKLSTELKRRGFRFETLLAPSFIGSHVTFGEGCIYLGFSICNNAKIGHFVTIMGSMIGDGEIGDYSTTTGWVNTTDATIGKRVFIGSHSVVLNRRRVGDDAFICAGSVVVRNVHPGEKVMGNPAVKVRF